MTFLLLLGAEKAWARLDGQVEWGYAHYQQDSDRNEKLTASHLTQRYSLMYSKKGLLADGKAGYYDLGIGAEWGSFDATRNDEEIGKSAFKILYDGQLLIAPGALPFRLNAYSYDTDKIRFRKKGVRYSFVNGSRERLPDGVLSPGIVSDLQNGQTIVSGLQLMVGIRNGSYLGQYRELLSQWPRLFIDYKDVYRRDMKSDFPQEYRDRNLAFVSLNKKDNWFHYRIKKHIDYLRPEQNQQEESMMLGTIDYLLKRHWIDLTNWIRISTDGSYTTIKDQTDPRPVERFDVNFYTTMQRKAFDAASFINMHRVKHGATLKSSLDLPFFINKEFNPNTSARLALQSWRNKEVSGGYRDELSREAYHTKLLLQTLKRSSVRFDPSLEVEVASGDSGDAAAMRGKVEVYSNLKFRNNLSWAAMASLANFETTDRHDRTTNLWESELEGSVSYRWRNMKAGVNQTLLYGKGAYASGIAHYLNSRTGSTVETSVDDETFLRSTSLLYLEHTASSGLNNRFTIDYRYQDLAGERSYAVEAGHVLRYRSRNWSVKSKNSYVTGADVDTFKLDDTVIERDQEAGPLKETFSHEDTVEFHPNHYWLSQVDGSVLWGKGFSGRTRLLYRLRQKVQRTFYARNSVRRKLADVSQSLVYQRSEDASSDQTVTFSLAGNYYPTSYWRLGGDISYSDYNNQSHLLTYSLTTDIDFPLFQLNFCYNYGATNAENKVAHRYEVNVKKTF